MLHADFDVDALVFGYVSARELSGRSVMIAYQTVVELADQPPLEEREPLYTNRKLPPMW